MLKVYLATEIKSEVYISTAKLPVYCGFVYIHSTQAVSYFESNERAKKDKRPWIKICHRALNAVSWRIVENDFDEIIVSSLWYDHQLPYLEQSMEILRRITDAHIVIVGNKALQWPDERNSEGGSEQIAEECYKSESCDGVDGVDGVNAFSVRYFESEKITKKWKELSSRFGFTYLDLRGILCSQDFESCSVYTDKRKPIYFDSGHFSNEGYKFVSDLIYGKEVLSPPLSTMVA